MGELQFQPQNAHRVAVDGRDLLFHVPTTALFEIDGLDGEVLSFLADKGRVTEADVRQRFADRDPAVVTERLRGLLDLDIVTDGRPPAAERPEIRIEQFPLSTIVLNVNTGCNLACSYCYKEDLQAPSKGEKMALDTAVRSIDMLLKRKPGSRQPITSSSSGASRCRTCR